MKQNGAVLAKGWLMGLQFATMLESGEYFEAAKRADALAMQIKKAFEDKGVPFAVESFTNQQFVILTEQQKQELAAYKQTKSEQEQTIRQLRLMAETNQKKLAALSKLEDQVRSQMEKSGAQLPPKSNASD